MFGRHHHIDSFALDDPKPGWFDCLRTGKWLLGMVYEPLQRHWHKALFNWHKKYGTVGKSLVKAKHIVFLCYGNINRSVLAEKCLIQQLGQASGFGIRSAGFHPKSNRPADPVMVAVAKEHGIDLSNWSSNLVEETMLADADIIFVMEISHFLIVSNKFPKFQHKVHLLGEVTENVACVPLEIADPYGQSSATYLQCFQQVYAASQMLAGLLTK